MGPQAISCDHDDLTILDTLIIGVIQIINDIWNRKWNLWACIIDPCSEVKRIQYINTVVWTRKWDLISTIKSLI